MKILRVYLRAVLMLFPLVFLPIVVDVFGAGKEWLLGGLTVVGLVIWALEMVIGKREEVKTNTIWWLVTAMVAWAVIGWWRLEIGLRANSLLNSGGLGTLLMVWSLMWLWLQVDGKEEREVQFKWLSAGGLLVLLVSIVVFLIPASKLPISWPKTNSWLNISSDWSLTGSLYNEIFLLGFLLAGWGLNLYRKLVDKESNDYMKEAVVTAVLFLGVMLAAFRVYRTGLVRLDGNSGWVIAVESFKSSPWWGVGPGNFNNAFSRFRPVSYNLGSYWSTGFRYSSSWLWQIWTELGLVAMIILGVMINSLWKQKRNTDWVWLAVLTAAMLYFPYNLTAVVLTAWLVSGGVLEKKRWLLGGNLPEGKRVYPAWVLSAVVTLGAIAGGYVVTRTVWADFYMRKSLVAAADNDGANTYNYQIKAIAINPWSAEYRRVYSQTNLALAKNLLAKSDISDEDKQKASVLIQQSVREAKAALALDSGNSFYWSNLAVIYRQIVGLVDGAADWSFQAYQQAVALDPVNPIIRLDMGGLLYAANRFDEADRVFEQVVLAKNDFANAWYNWAYTAKKMNKVADAVQRLTQAVALVPVDSGDFDTASKELGEWKKELEELQKKQGTSAEATAPKPETLVTPEPLPTTNKKNEVPVPTGELAPPEEKNSN